MSLAPAAPLFSFGDDEAGPDARPRAVPYVAALDGLRAVAVLAVLVYHQNPARLPGGFLGVDVFFALSGFLITSLLLAEQERSQRIDLRRFWSHRLRRLLPGLLLTILLVSAYARWLAAEGSLGELRGDSLASLAYVLNWRFVLEGRSYFFEFFPSPLRHLWSLAVEEQWYLVWPLVLSWFLRGEAGEGRRGARRVLWLSLALAAASTAAMALAFTPGADPSRAYYGTDTHAAPLLLGAALAALLAGRRRPPVQLPPRRGAPAPPVVSLPGAVGLAGLAGLLWAFSVARGDAAWLYRGGFALVAVLTGMVVLAAVTPERGPWWSNPVRAVLSLAPARWLGRISYGVYLYHWPLWFVLTADRTGLVGARLFVVRLGATLALATASYLLVEQPIRHGRPTRLPAPKLLAPGAVAATVLVLFGSTAGATAPWLTRSDLDIADRPAPEVPATAPGAPPEVVPSRVLVVGDSVAYTLAIGFEGDVSDDAELAVWNQAILYCELLPLPRREGGPGGETRAASDRCEDWDAPWGDAVDEFDPDVAVLHVGPWEIFDRRHEDRWVSFGSAAFDELLGHELRRVVDELARHGAHVVLLTSPPLERTDGVTSREWTSAERWRTNHLNDLLHRLADEARTDGIPISVIDLAGFVCPSPATGCPEERDGVALRGDGIHYTEAGAATVAAWLAPQLRELGLAAARDRAARPPAVPTTGASTIPPSPSSTGPDQQGRSDETGGSAGGA